MKVKKKKKKKRVLLIFLVTKLFCLQLFIRPITLAKKRNTSRPGTVGKMVSLIQTRIHDEYPIR